MSSNNAHSTKHPRGQACLMRVLRGERVERAPIWFMRQAGRYLPEFRELRRREPDFLSFCQSQELTCQAALQPLARYDLDAAIVFADILTIPHALGMALQFIPGTGPVFAQALTLTDWSQQLNVHDVQARLNYVSRNVATLRSALPPTTPLIGFSGCPWTLLAYMLSGRSEPGFPSALSQLRTHPESCHAVLTLLREVIVDYLLAQVASGADVVMLFDTWAGCLPDDLFERYVNEQLTPLVNSFRQNAPNTPLLLFGKGCNHRLTALANTGAHGLGVDHSSSLQAARCSLPAHHQHVVLQGNLAPTTLLSSPVAITDAVKQMYQDFDPHQHHIANLGHGVLPTIDPEHVSHWVNTVREITTQG